MDLAQTRPCASWADDLDECCRAGGSCSGDIPVDYDATEVLAWATHIVWALSGRRYGLCEATVRPCRRTCLENTDLASWFAWRWPYPTVPLRDFAGNWVNLGCGCRSACGCTAISEFKIPRGPIAEVVEVKVDGVVLVEDVDYRVDGWRKLVRLGGRWPLCQDLNKADTEVGTWSIDWVYGVLPPISGVKAVQTLACELAKACVGGPCALPRRVQQMTRQGTTMLFTDPLTMFDKGRTGITEVDLFLIAANPRNLPTRARIFRADRRPRGRQVGS